MPPWFQANVWFEGGGTKTHGLVQFGAAAKKKYSPRANIVNVGVLGGSAVIMCSVFSPTVSIIATDGFSVAPVYGFSVLRLPMSRSRVRVIAASRAGFPLM